MAYKNSPVGISKSLLTPCRRVGLSRIRRSTPNNISPGIFSNTPSPSIIRDETPLRKNETSTNKSMLYDSPCKLLSSNSSNTNETPLRSNETYMDDTIFEDTCKVSNNLKKSLRKKKLHRRILIDPDNEKNKSQSEINEDPVNNLTCRNVKETSRLPVSSDGEKNVSEIEINQDPVDISTPKDVKRNRRILISDDEKSVSGTEINEVPVDNLISKKVKQTRRLCVFSDDEDNVSESEVNNVEINNLTCENSQQNNVSNIYHQSDDKILGSSKAEKENKCSKETNNPSRNLRRCLSMKKSYVISSEDEDFQPVKTIKKYTSLPECQIRLTKLPQNIDSQLTTENNIEIKKREKGDSDEGDDDFLCSPKDRLALLDKIKCLEDRVKSKKDTLTKLQQAQLYQKKHNIKELNELTDKWKLGCTQSISDLLLQLQKHGEMNLKTLLVKLNIPSEVASSLFENVNGN